ncbi:NAD(P)-dependent oxidoreductase [bacterium]|nr:NAD(P)-dependent oxidoreductase [bacterium]
MTNNTRAVGFIGLGRMGRGMALNLITSIDRLHVYDAQPDAMAVLTKAGAQPCRTPAEVARRCDCLFLCLPSAPEVRTVIFGAEGVASAGRGGLTIIDTTTLDRSDAIRFAEDAAKARMAYWDCPISGMPFRADDGTLTVMFGGAKEAFEAVKPLLETFGKDIIHSGPVGSGQAMKAINNIIYDVNIAALCEVLPLAIAVGLDPEQLARLVTTASSRSFASEYFVPRILERRFDTDFTLKDAYKDIVNVQRMGVETRASLPVVNAMIGSYQAAIAAGFGDEPKSAMLKVYENALGVQFGRKKPEDE